MTTTTNNSSVSSLQGVTTIAAVKSIYSALKDRGAYYYDSADNYRNEDGTRSIIGEFMSPARVARLKQLGHSDTAVSSLPYTTMESLTPNSVEVTEWTNFLQDIQDFTAVRRNFTVDSLSKSGYKRFNSICKAHGYKSPVTASYLK